MSEFKVGDRVRKVASSHLWSFNKGEELTVTGFSSLGNVWVSDGKESDTAYVSDLELISRAPENPPATITHEGYTYTRGERVRPDWLKDGNWVVWKRPELMGRKEEIIYIDGPLTKTKCAKTGLITRRTMENMIAEFRPHEPSDYKWGDWAMYEGKKVIVISKVYDGLIAISHEDFSYGCSCEPVSKLIPTHAP